MNKIQLFKKYSDGEIRSVTVNETEDNLKQLFSYGYFLTEAEAKSGVIADEPPADPEPPAKPARKPAAKKPTVKVAKKEA